MQTSLKYLTRSEAVAYVAERGLIVTKGTMAKFATCGGGAKYQVFCGRAYYLPGDLDEWIALKLSAPRCSTSEVRS
ncbi:MAG: DNA-binding protein [Rhizobiales bacterium]|nr:DNA-binding protein [Hyphomicrobiales bacterium]